MIIWTCLYDYDSIDVNDNLHVQYLTKKLYKIMFIGLFGFVGLKKNFIGLLSFMKKELFGESLASSSKRRINCVSLNNWTCQAKSSFIDVSSNGTLFHPFPEIVNKCDEVIILLMIDMLEYFFLMK